MPVGGKSLHENVFHGMTIDANRYVQIRCYNSIFSDCLMQQMQMDMKSSGIPVKSGTCYGTSFRARRCNQLFYYEGYSFTGDIDPAYNILAAGNDNPVMTRTAITDQIHGDTPDTTLLWYRRSCTFRL